MAQVQEAAAERAIRPMVLTHGTLEIDDVHESMRFYRDFLGMEVVQHVPFGCRVSLGAAWYVVCLEVKHPHDMPVFNHFGFDCASRAEVDAWHARAVAEREAFGLLEVLPPRSLHGGYSFFFKDRDRNWWEIQYYEGGADDNLAWGQRMLANAARNQGRRAQRG
ncbi:MAG TPA: VOC family protein [Chloroflexota bacterium]|jgi:catechol 2,3-dioxygenase-like lactoylglutathione lyase family enzyme